MNDHGSNGRVENTHDEAKSNKGDTFSRPVAENEIECQKEDTAIAGYSECYDESLQTIESAKCNECEDTTTSNEEVVISDMLSFEEIESDSALHSSALTSPSTTAGTFTLPAHSPETEIGK